MVGVVSELVGDFLASLALVVGSPSLTSTLVLLGATSFVAATLVLLARMVATVVPGIGAAIVPRTRAAADVVPLVPQRDPDAAGRVRPRAPGVVLG